MARIFKKREYRHWSDPEIDKLRHGKLPAGRTYAQCCTKALSLGLPKPESPTGRHKWKPEEIVTMKGGDVPEGRTVTACVTRGYYLGLRVTPLENGKLHVESMQDDTPAHRRMLARAEILSRMRDEGLSYAQIARKVGVSRQYVADMVNKYRETARYIKAKEKSDARLEQLAKEFNEAR